MNVNHLARQPARSRMRRRFDVPKANQNEINKYDQILPLAQERASMKQDLLNKGLTPKTEMLTIQQQVRHGQSIRATLCALISVATISIPLVPQSVTADTDPMETCNALAAHPYDSYESERGVQFTKINTDAALPACQKAVIAHPRLAQAHFLLGRVLERTHDLVGAEREYRAAAEAPILCDE